MTAATAAPALTNVPWPGANAPGAFQQFGRAEMNRVEALLRQQWSPEQVAGHLRGQGEFAISHETIYRHVWRDLRRGGTLYVQMRGARKQRRKRYGRYDSRGRLAGKRHISERPAEVESRQQLRPLGNRHGAGNNERVRGHAR